jgi:phospholipid/cholesterol/gamma-HCH transport system substrate-binding protein
VRLGVRQLVNALLVGAVGLVAMIWSIAGLAQLRPFDEPATVVVRVARSGGALPGSEVTYLGVPVGKVTSARLAPDAVVLRLAVEPKGPMAKELRADVRTKSALGEPYVDLAPARPGVPAGDPDGAVIPLERTTVPRPLSVVLERADALLHDVDPADLRAVIDGASGVVGHEQALRDLVTNGADVAEVVARRRNDLGQLLGSAATLTAALDTHRDELGAAITGFARLGDVLARRTGELQSILDEGGRLGTDGSDLLARSRPDLDGVLAGLDATFGNLARRPDKLREIVDLVPTMIDRFGRTFEGGSFWLSAGGATPFAPGYQPRYGVPIYGKGFNVDRIFLPSVAQRIDVDLGGRPPSEVYRLLGPEDSAVAANSPLGFLAIQEREQERMAEAGPAVAP